MATTTTTVPAFGSSIALQLLVATRVTSGGQTNQAALTTSFSDSILNFTHQPLTKTEKDTLFNFLIAHAGEIFTVSDTTTGIKYEAILTDDISVDFISKDEANCALYAVSYVTEGKIIGA